MRVTLRDISKKSGFSVTTISRALAGYSDVNESTRQEIIRIANELGYQPNQIARQLQGKRTYTIGLIMPPRPHTDDDDFFSLFLKGVTYAAARNQYDVLVSATSPESSEMDAYRRIVGGNRVDGMVLARTFHNDPRIQYLQSVNHPFIVLGRSAPDETTDFPYIDVDSKMGIQALVTHMIAAGHREIGIILPPEEVSFTAYRLAGYREALEKAHIPFRPEYCIHSDLSFSGGQEAARLLLDRAPQLTAMVGSNDWMALGAMKIAQDRGIEVGRDFAVGGYDDIPAAAQAVPALTTVRWPIYGLGEELTRRLLKFIDRDSEVERQQLVEPELIIRDSVGKKA
ncbi:MAG: LacI family transcriptional regulator [Anaerolineae bacterium]|nr:LacI family transcriptional regulator [Anaerolineae bacterium]